MRLFIILLLVTGFAAVAPVGGAAADVKTEPMIRPSFGDVPYATLSRSEVMDVYVPGGTGPFPVVLYIHGGAFRYGSKDEPRYGDSMDVRILLNVGIAIASINYRMSAEAPFPAAVIDARAAVRWLRAHAEKLSLDPARIALWGKSAGGNIALLVAMSDGDKIFDDPRLENNNIPSQVRGVVALYAPTDFLSMDVQNEQNPMCRGAPRHNAPDSAESLYIGSSIQENMQQARAASPANYVASAAVPVLLQAGTHDCTVPVQQSQALYDALLPRLGPGKISLTMLTGATHADPVFDRVENLTVIRDFLRGVLQR